MTRGRSYELKMTEYVLCGSGCMSVAAYGGLPLLLLLSQPCDVSRCWSRSVTCHRQPPRAHYWVAVGADP
jgi:hypothetical protein